ncbi:MAG: translation elongation factor Ts [Kiritimatiellaeota bacterium]|nr:translation elongation factor Ts [Kiritimatiellota bacterium]
MTEVSAALVKELREETSVGMMDCKQALVAAGGDKAQAIKILRERGLAVAGKKAARAAKEGVVAAEILQGGKVGVLIEVNCETDFVTRNDSFKELVRQLQVMARTVPGELAAAARELVVAKIASIGENIIVRRNVRYEVPGEGVVASYIHLGGKVGVLVEVGCGLAASSAQDAFRNLVKDITLHIAACNPQYLARQDVPAAVLQAEKEIYAKQVQNKPANIIEKIVVGKLEKFYSQTCLVEQGFVKDPEQSVTELLAAKGKELGDQLVIRRFARFQVGVE